jgi:hypothetical protein
MSQLEQSKGEQYLPDMLPGMSREYPRTVLGETGGAIRR